MKMARSSTKSSVCWCNSYNELTNKKSQNKIQNVMTYEREIFGWDSLTTERKTADEGGNERASDDDAR